MALATATRIGARAPSVALNGVSKRYGAGEVERKEAETAR